jgi:hypothetical protein
MTRVLTAGFIALAVVAVSFLSIGATAFAQESDTTSISVLSFEVSPSEPAPGETVTVTASVNNPGTTTVEEVLEVTVNGLVVASSPVSLESGETGDVTFSFNAPVAGEVELMVGEITKVITVGAQEPVKPSEGRMRVGPSVRLDTRQSKITSQQDAVIDLFWNNSSLNDLATHIEVSMDVPSGLYMYSQDGAMACAAGRCQGTFTAPPGSVRNMPIIIKADSAGNYFIHMNGRYWPQNDRDKWTPMSLSTPIRVMEPSPKPGDPRPTSNIEPSPSGAALEAGSDMGKAWWLTPMALVMWSLMAIVLVVMAGFRAISRTVRAARSEPPTIEIG